MNKVICTTTINPPTEALIKFAKMEGWQLVIAGDKKSPRGAYDREEFNTTEYLSPWSQEQMDQKLSDLIGWNCIQRRNFAFLFACKELKADVIATVDDDNIPNEDWGKDLFVGKDVDCDTYNCDQEAFDPLSITCHNYLWHRGFPLELVKGSEFGTVYAGRSIRKCDVQADLWDGEADVDAICRLTRDSSDCKFIPFSHPYTSNKPSPFNSQNTFLTREVMPHYFMFPGVGRMDDIFASYHVQAQGFRVMYGRPTVTQKRNEHDTMTDLKNEIYGMEHSLAIVNDIPINKKAVINRLPGKAAMAFQKYQQHFE